MATDAMVADLSGYSNIPKIVAEFDKQKPRLLAAIKEAGGKLVLRINVPNLRLKTAKGTSRFITGRKENGQCKVYDLTAESLESAFFSPGLGLGILQYLDVEEHNASCEVGMRKRHNRVLLNDQRTWVTPFDVGSEKFFQEEALREQRDDKPLFAQTAMMSKPEENPAVTEEMKQKIAAQQEIARRQAEMDSNELG